MFQEWYARYGDLLWIIGYRDVLNGLNTAGHRQSYCARSKNNVKKET